MAPLIYPNDRADAKEVARQLLAAAGARSDEIRTTTDGPLGVAFEVPDDLAQQVLNGERTVVETSGPDGAGLVSTSADAGADVSEADAETEGASQPPSKASRSRSPRSR